MSRRMLLSSVAVIGLALAAITIAADPPKEGAAPQLPPGWTEADMKAMVEAGTPGKMHKFLADSAAGRLVPPQRYGEIPKWVERAGAAARAAEGSAASSDDAGA